MCKEAQPLHTNFNITIYLDITSVSLKTIQPLKLLLS